MGMRGENIVSPANTMLILSRLYNYNADKFFGLIDEAQLDLELSKDLLVGAEVSKYLLFYTQRVSC